MKHFLGFEQTLDLGLSVHDLPLRRNLIFRLSKEQHLISPEFQRFPGLQQFFVNASKQPIARHEQPPDTLSMRID